MPKKRYPGPKGSDEYYAAMREANAKRRKLQEERNKNNWHNRALKAERAERVRAANVITKGKGANAPIRVYHPPAPEKVYESISACAKAFGIRREAVVLGIKTGRFVALGHGEEAPKNPYVVRDGETIDENAAREFDDMIDRYWRWYSS